MFDLISIGDSVIDTYVSLTDGQILEKDGQRLLAMRYGDKIPVEPSVSLVGGNAANNAIGSSRLGLKTAVYTNVGNKDDDEADDRIIAKFKKEKVDTRYVIENADMHTGHHIVLNYKGERTILTYHEPWKYNLPDLDKTRWLYFTSLAPSYLQSAVVEQVVNFVERSGAKLAFQPGTFQIKVGPKKSARLLSLCEFFILNKEEAKLYLGHEESTAVEIKKLLKGLINLGPKQVVVTDGRNGSYGFDGEDFYKLELFPAKVLEMTGAGDAYATGVVAGLSHGQSLPEAMRWGAANGAAVVEQIGPQAGLLTYEEMQERLKENSQIKAKKI